MNPLRMSVDQVAEAFQDLHLRDGAPSGSQPYTNPFQQENSTVLKLKGLPYSATAEQILDFFRGFNVREVAFVREPDGRPSGLAFAEFATKEEAIQALNKNGEYIGERYVKLLRVPKSEMEDQVRHGTLAIPGQAAELRNRLLKSQRGLVYPPSSLQMLPSMMNQTTRPIIPYSSNLGSSGSNAQMPIDSRLWSPQYASSLQLSQPYPQLSLPSVGGGSAAHLPQMPLMAMPNPILPSTLGLQTLQAPMPQVLRDLRQPAQQLSSSTIKIRGLPYHVSPAEILAFFQGYQYLPNTLQIGLDASSRPSGEAWLTFLTPLEAARAIRDLNRHYLGNRYLELSLC